ncbi:MAG: hypothetical protein LBH19_05525 [Dysgonamonadaceae bacterium]|jgi:hypothetical protein|nr:hypothetical protein [Dysgonamonadaceae bacterium]
MVEKSRFDFRPAADYPLPEYDYQEKTPEQEAEAAAEKKRVAERNALSQATWETLFNEKNLEAQKKTENPVSSNLAILQKFMPVPVRPAYEMERNRQYASIAESMKSLAEIFGQSRGAHLQPRKPEEADKADARNNYLQQKYDADMKEYARALIQARMTDRAEAKQYKDKKEDKQAALDLAEKKHKWDLEILGLKNEAAIEKAEKAAQFALERDANKFKSQKERDEALARYRIYYRKVYGASNGGGRNTYPINYIDEYGEVLPTGYDRSTLDYAVTQAIADPVFFNANANLFEVKNPYTGAVEKTIPQSLQQKQLVASTYAKYQRDKGITPAATKPSTSNGGSNSGKPKKIEW